MGTTTKNSFSDKRLMINIRFVTIYILLVTIFFIVTNIAYNSDKTKKYHNKYIKISDKDKICHYLSIDYSFYLSQMLFIIVTKLKNVTIIIKNTS